VHSCINCNTVALWEKGYEGGKKNRNGKGSKHVEKFGRREKGGKTPAGGKKKKKTLEFALAERFFREGPTGQLKGGRVENYTTSGGPIERKRREIKKPSRQEGRKGTTASASV